MSLLSVIKLKTMKAPSVLSDVWNFKVWSNFWCTTVVYPDAIVTVWPDGLIMNWKFGHFQHKNFCPITAKFDKVGDYCAKYTIIKWPKVFKMLPKWGNFAKSGHTVSSDDVTVTRSVEAARFNLNKKVPLQSRSSVYLYRSEFDFFLCAIK